MLQTKKTETTSSEVKQALPIFGDFDLGAVANGLNPVKH